MSYEPSDVLTSVLEWLEERIDLEHLERVARRHRDVMNYLPVDRPPVSIKGVEIEDFPRYAFQEEFEDPIKLMVDQLAHPIDDLVPGVASSVLLKDDFPLQIQSEFGIGIMPSLFGAESTFAAGGRAWVEPLGGPTETARLLDRGVPDMDSGLLPRVLETMAMFRAELDDYPRCSRGIRITQPDLQGCVDILHLLWGQDFFLSLYDHRQLVHNLLDLIAETYVAVVRKIQPYTTQECGDGCIYLHWALCRGQLLLKNDTPVMLSPEMYTEFCAGYDRRIFQELGDGGVHFCGSGDHWREEMADTEGLRCVDFGQSDLNDMDAWYEALRRRDISIMRLPYPAEKVLSGEYIERFPTGVSFSTWAPDLEGGQRIMETLRQQEQ
jgi:hypothetical protein